MRLCGINSRFQLLSPCVRQVTHALLTRPPLSISNDSSEASFFGLGRDTPFDLHVLSTPPAFILSQDQTLIKSLYVLKLICHLAYKFPNLLFKVVFQKIFSFKVPHNTSYCSALTLASRYFPKRFMQASLKIFFQSTFTLNFVKKFRGWHDIKLSRYKAKKINLCITYLFIRFTCCLTRQLVQYITMIFACQHFF